MSKLNTMKTAMMESAHDLTEQAYRLWQRTQELRILTETIILDIERICQRTRVSITTSRTILGKGPGVPTHGRRVWKVGGRLVGQPETVKPSKSPGSST
jgi:hypothetical protein